MDDQRNIDRFVSAVQLRPLVRSWGGFTLEIHPPTVADQLRFGEVVRSEDREEIALWLFWNAVGVEGARVRDNLTLTQVRAMDGCLVVQAANAAFSLYDEAARPLTPPGT